MNPKTIFILFGILLTWSFGNADAQSLQPVDLRTQYAVHPLGVDEPQPGLSWKLHVQSEERGRKQTAYRILVASKEDILAEGQADIWDSGKVNSDETVQILYKGPDLKSAKRYYWRVSVWDQDGRQSEYSDTAWFETGLLNPVDWKAVWISAIPDHSGVPIVEESMKPQPAPHFRKEFNTRNEIISARLYISGLGYYEAFMNGERVGDHLMDPAVTRYDKTVLYETYDVTEMLLEGNNAIGVILGTGWYNFHALAAWDFDHPPWRAPPSLKAQLTITYEDGTTQTVKTDRSWQVRTGPIVFDGIHNGETYDARLELDGWASADTEIEDWQEAFEVLGPAGTMKSQLMPPIRNIRSLQAESVNHPKPGVIVYDFGENIAGRVRLTASGPEGAEIVIRHGERLYEGGTLDQEELRRFVFSGETQTSRYILGPDQPSDWSPSFSYHGFQYAEVTVPEGVTIHELEAEVLHTDFVNRGSFSSSNPLLNKVHQAMRNSYLGNYHGYPTDCPHREKIGWSGDAHLVAEAGLYNFDATTAYLKWLDDFADEQRASGQIPGIIPTSGWGYTFGGEENIHSNRGYGPQWEGAFVLIPWQLYLHSGDRSILSRYYNLLKHYVLYLERHADPDYTLSFGIDDHKALTHTGPAILASGYFYTFSKILGKMASELDNNEDQYYFEDLADKIRKGYRQRFYNKKANTWGNGSQTSLSGTLYHSLADSSETEGILEQLLRDLEDKEYHLDTGVVGTKYMMNVLTKYGYADVTYQIAAQRTYPSWGYWIEQGATTLWQNWVGSQSRNHVMFGSIGEWFYDTLAGIRPDPTQPGFKRIIIRPAFGTDLEWVEGSHKSLRGRIESKWRRTDQNIKLTVRIPVNTTAYVYLPGVDVGQIYEGGIPLSQVKEIDVMGKEDDRLVVETGSGVYQFSIELD